MTKATAVKPREERMKLGLQTFGRKEVRLPEGSGLSPSLAYFSKVRTLGREARLAARSGPVIQTAATRGQW